jgi:TnpA family transposase
LVHLKRLKTVRRLALPEGLEAAVHQNRLLKLARGGGQMTAQHLRDLKPDRRYATLVAVLIETRTMLIDEIIDLHDRFMAALFGQAKRHHLERFEQSGKALNDKVCLYSRIGRAGDAGQRAVAPTVRRLVGGRHHRVVGRTALPGRRPGEFAAQVNLKYGQEPGVQFYTHLADQYAPFHTKVINATVRDATYVLDGLLYHESDLRIAEHYTDTAGFTDQVFGLMHLLGFRFAPRIRDLADKRLYIQGEAKASPTLAGLIGGTLNVKHIRAYWDDLLRLAASIRQGTVTASLMLRKLASYPRQNGLAVALRELGRIERSLFALDWMQHVDLRRRVQVGLNKGEAKNALARAVFLNRLGELRDRSFEHQRYRASGLNLAVAAIVLWNTVYLERAVQTLRDVGATVDDTLLPHLSPLGWEHINLTGDYIWRQSKQVEQGELRPLRVRAEA